MTVEPLHTDKSWSNVSPIRVVALAAQPAEGDDFAFHAVEKDTDQKWSGVVQAPSAEAALLEAFVKIRSEIHHEDRIRFLVLLPRGSALWVYHNEIRAALPRCTVQGPSRGDAALMAAANSALASVAAVAAQRAEITLPPLVVSADGSVRGRFSGHGWLASDGQSGLCGRVDSKKIVGSELSLIAELRAIDAAVQKLTRRHLTVFCDNSHAVSMARRWMNGDQSLPTGYTTDRAGGKTAGLVNARLRIHLNRERLDIRWIRSHQGEPLNEGADALARLASRYARGDSGLSAACYSDRAGGLAKAFAAEFRKSAAESNADTRLSA